MPKKINCEVLTFCGILFQNNKTKPQILIAQCIKGDSFCFSVLFGFVFFHFIFPSCFFGFFFFRFPPTTRWEIEEQSQATGAQSFGVKLWAAWQPSERQCDQSGAASQDKTALTSGTVTLKPLRFNNSWNNFFWCPFKHSNSSLSLQMSHLSVYS